MKRPLKGNYLVIQPLLHSSSFKINNDSEGKDLGSTEGTQHLVFTENKIPSSKKTKQNKPAKTKQTKKPRNQIKKTPTPKTNRLEGLAV